MKYEYLYQTKDNENRRGWINAKDRADAYTLLRKRGIRPYRVIGDDPVNWRPWALGAAFAVLASLAAVAAYFAFARAPAAPDAAAPSRRCQIESTKALADAASSGWETVFPLKLDRYLAAYAQPGWIAIPPDLADGDLERFKDDLAAPFDFPDGDAPEIALLRRIVLAMRGEFADYLASGGTVREYLDFLEERQDEELSLRRAALESVERAAPAMRERTRMNVNVRLREMGLPELGE